MLLIYVPFFLGLLAILGGVVVWWKHPKRIVSFGFKIPKTEIDKLSLGLCICVIGVGLVVAPMAFLAYFHADAFFELVSRVVPEAKVEAAMKTSPCDGSHDDAFIYQVDGSVLDLRGYRHVPKVLESVRISPANLTNTLTLKKVKDERYVRMSYGTTSPAGIEARCLDWPYSSVEKRDGDHPRQIFLCIDTGDTKVGDVITITNEITYWNAYNDKSKWWYETYSNKQNEKEKLSIAIIFPNDKPGEEIRRYQSSHGAMNDMTTAGSLVTNRDRLTVYWPIEAQASTSEEITYKLEWTWKD